MVFLSVVNMEGNVYIYQNSNSFTGALLNSISNFPCISPFCNSRRGKVMNADSKVKLSSVSLLTPLKLQ